MELRLQKSTSDNLGAADQPWVTDNLAHTIIKRIDLQLNGTLNSPQSDTYHYKAYIEDLLNFNRKDGKTVLAPQGWFNAVDFPPEWTATNTTANAGAGHAHWVAISANHKVALAKCIAETANYVEGTRYILVFQPHLDLSHSGKVLVPGMEIKMKFHFNSPNLFLNGVGLDGRLVEGEIRLRFHLCQLRLNETIYKTLSAQRHNGKQLASYPTVRSEIRSFSRQGNLTRFDIPSLFQNRIPDRLIVGLLDSRAFSGDVTRDPFCFQKFGVRPLDRLSEEKSTLMKPSTWFTTVQPEIIWGTFVFFELVEPGAKSKVTWWDEEIGDKLKIVPRSCLTM